MDVIRKDNVEMLEPRQLKKYYIFSTSFLVIIILIMQIFQDNNHRQEYLDAKRIHFYQQFASLGSQIKADLLVIRDGNVLEMDFSTRQLSQAIIQVELLQAELKAVKAQRRSSYQIERTAEQERLLVAYIDKLLLSANQALSLEETDRLHKRPKISELYEQVSLDFELYENNYDLVIESLSESLHKTSHNDRMVLWLMVTFFLILVVIMGVVSYRVSSLLASRQLEFIEEENKRRQKNSQQMQDQVALMHAEQMKMRSILDHTVDSIITITADGRIDSFNKTAEKMFGYLAAEVIGQNVKLLMPEGYAKEHDGYLKNYMDTGVRKIIGIGREVVAQRKDKSQFPIYLSVSEVPESQPRLFTGIVSDMTKWKKSDEKLQQTLAELRNKQVMLEDEEKIARHVFANITANNNDDLPELTSWIVPMGTFSGDMMLSAVLPSGATRVLLCDFTGHGLPAALGAVPVSSVHKAMAQKDLPLEVLMEELNNKLKSLLPTGIFCCIAGIDIDATRTHAHIWNAGLPEVLVVSKSGEIKQRVKSAHLPLGVVTYKASNMHCVDVALEAGDSIYAYSDGMTEAENPNGEMLGQQRFEDLLTVAVEDGDRMMSIQNTVKHYINNAPAKDDLSLLQIKTLVMADEIILES